MNKLVLLLATLSCVVFLTAPSVAYQDDVPSTPVDPLCCVDAAIAPPSQGPFGVWCGATGCGQMQTGGCTAAGQVLWSTVDDAFCQMGIEGDTCTIIPAGIAFSFLYKCETIPCPIGAPQCTWVLQPNGRRLAVAKRCDANTSFCF